MGKDNMISWLAARCDGQIMAAILYQFPKQKLIYGPRQIEARIDQDPEYHNRLLCGHSRDRGWFVAIFWSFRL